MDFRTELMFPDLAVADRDALLDLLGAAVTDLGMAKDGYAAALKEREHEFPTGLPISGGVAIPHTSAEFVTGNTIVAATLTNPVSFFEMGGDEGSEAMVSTVFLLVFADSHSHVPLLAKVIANIQDEQFVNAIKDAHTAQAMAAVLTEAFPAEMPTS